MPSRRRRMSPKCGNAPPDSPSVSIACRCFAIGTSRTSRTTSKPCARPACPIEPPTARLPWREPPTVDRERKPLPTPKEYKSFVDQITRMWQSQPHWTPGDFAAIKTPTWIADPDHDEMITHDPGEAFSRLCPPIRLLL